MHFVPRLFPESSSTIPVRKGKVEEESRKRNVQSYLIKFSSSKKRFNQSSSSFNNNISIFTFFVLCFYYLERLEIHRCCIFASKNLAEKTYQRKLITERIAIFSNQFSETYRQQPVSIQ
ncbi:hypothetical protein BpHYR1_036644 [Brachionus plicatilis]|uniref:Uncharacterized protein n=1 Tax=Brachionus plicatilis TaxID=10195 RepID=A0A3M7SMY8_BRAPC|nr:hypothetical protein BpHYR1_036644 [Brachionus plicatilis]